MDNTALKKAKFIKNRRGQGMIETSIILVIVFLLVGGIMQIWLWKNNQIIRRQVHYNETRVQAGLSPLESWLYRMQWPLERDEEITEGSKYSPFSSQNNTQP